MSSQSDFQYEEYRSLRAEIIRSMEDGNQIMAFGLGAVGLVLTAALSAKDSMLTFFLLALLVPALSVLALSMWFAAQERTARASFFLSGVERRLKSSAGMEHLPSWEAWLRNPRTSKQSNHFWSTEQTAFGLFYSIAVVSMGLSFTSNPHLRLWLQFVVVGATALVLTPVVISLRGRFRRWRTWLSTTFDPAVDYPAPSAGPAS